MKARGSAQELRPGCTPSGQRFCPGRRAGNPETLPRNDHEGILPQRWAGFGSESVGKRDGDAVLEEVVHVEGAVVAPVPVADRQLAVAGQLATDPQLGGPEEVGPPLQESASKRVTKKRIEAAVAVPK